MIRKIVKVIIAMLLVVGCAVGAYFGAKDYFSSQPAPEPLYEARGDLDNEKIDETTIGEYTVEPDRPRYLSIPRLDITNARVMELGTVGPDQRLDDPTNINDTGWYRESAKPGAATPQRPAGLYDGHNTGIYANGVFYRLGELVAGDQVIIERGDGAKFTYTVRETALVRLEEVDMAAMMQSVVPGIEGLNIITCGGDWDKNNQTYTHRVVIRATIE